jgi:hypothetical protein
MVELLEVLAGHAFQDLAEHGIARPGRGASTARRSLLALTLLTARLALLASLLRLPCLRTGL